MPFGPQFQLVGNRPAAGEFVAERVRQPEIGQGVGSAVRTGHEMLDRHDERVVPRSAAIEAGRSVAADDQALLAIAIPGHRYSSITVFSSAQDGKASATLPLLS